MKISQKELKQIILEELQKMLNEKTTYIWEPEGYDEMREFDESPEKFCGKNGGYPNPNKVGQCIKTKD